MKWSVRVGLLLGLTGLVVVVTVLLNVASNDSASPVGLGVLAVPGLGETTAGLLDDGHPVFVVHDLDGTVVVIEAVSTHVVADLMAWCPSSRTIDDVFHGARWDAQGRYVAGPGSSDLGRYEIQVLEGEEELVVVAYVDPPPRSQSPQGIAGPGCFDDGYEGEVHPYYEPSGART